MVYDVIIVGAGAAGLFAAANMPESVKCLVLENGNSPGRKLLIAGNGQCNITHSGEIRDFLSHYGFHGKSIRSILYAFNNRAVIQFFRQRGVPLAERADGKVFPQTLRGEDILDALIRSINDKNVSFAYNAPVTSIVPIEIPSDALPNSIGYSVTAGGVRHLTTRVIVAAGGRSFPQTGSDGSIMPVLNALGQPLVPQLPALTPIFTNNYSYGRMSGISLRDVRASIVSQDPSESCYPRKRGDLLLTHRGFSGPVILELSRYAHQGDFLSICYLPGMDSSEVCMSIKLAVAGSVKQFSTVMAALYGTRIPSRFLDALSRRAGIDPSLKASTVPGAAIKRLSVLLTGDTHSIASLGGFDTAMVTVGGVALEGVDLKTLQSKLFPGLYFAGEVLDVDGDTGGYNLQFAFSSGYLTAKQI